MKSFVSAFLVLLSCCLPVVAMEPVPVADTSDDMDVVEWIEDSSFSNDTWCSYNAKELKTISKVIDMFDEHAEKKIVQRLFSDSAYQELARELTDDFVTTISYVTEYCDSGIRLGDFPWDYEQFIWELETYVHTLGALRTFSKKDLVEDDRMVQEMRLLRDHLLGEHMNLLKEDVFVREVANLFFGLEVDEEDGQRVSVGMDWKSDVISNMFGSIGEGTMSLAGDVIIDDAGEHVEVGMDLAGGFVMSNGNLFVKLDELMFDIDEDSYSGSSHDLEEFEMMEERLKLIEGKYIDLGSFVNGAGTYALRNSMSLLDQQKMIKELIAHDWLITYYEEDRTRYGGLNPLACKSLAAFGGVGDCLALWQEMYLESDGKGVIMLRELKDTMTLGLSDRFTEHKLTEELAPLNNHGVITWNEDKLVLIDIPLGTQGHAMYKDGKVTVHASFPSWEYNWESGEYEEVLYDLSMYGLFKDGQGILEGTFTAPDVVVTLDMTTEGTLQDMYIDLQVDVEGTSEWNKMDVTFHMKGDVSETIVDELVEVTIPDEDDIVDLEMLMYSY